MSYIARSVTGAGVKAAVALMTPIYHCPTGLSIISVTRKVFFSRTIDFSNIDYLLVSGTTTSDAGALDFWDFQIGGVQELLITGAATIFQTIDCTAITGEKLLEFAMWNETASKYAAWTNLLVQSTESAYP